MYLLSSLGICVSQASRLVSCARNGKSLSRSERLFISYSVTPRLSASYLRGVVSGSTSQLGCGVFKGMQ